MVENRYKKGQIYKIVDVGYNLCYIGSTCESLCQRMSRHRICYRHYQKTGKNPIKLFIIFDEYGVENCKIELLEDYHCNTKNELERREGEFIKCSECVNKVIAGRTYKEWCLDNKETIKQSNKANYAKDKDTIKEEYYLNQEENQKKCLDRYYSKKDAINDRRKATYVCECGVELRFDCKARHERSKHHQQFHKQEE